MSQIMKHDKQTAKGFYRHAESGDVFVIERSWDGEYRMGSSRIYHAERATDI